MSSLAAPTHQPHALTIGFLTVPVEIRRQIYAEILVCKFHICFCCFDPEQITFDLDPDCRIQGLHPAILGVNKAIHDEAADVLYAQNRFRLSHLREKHLECPTLEPFFLAHRDRQRDADPPYMRPVGCADTGGQGRQGLETCTFCG